MRCCNNVTERLTGIALPVLGVTAKRNSMTSAAAAEVCQHGCQHEFWLFSLHWGVVVKQQ